MNIGRSSLPAALSLVYANAVDPTTFVDFRSYAMMVIGPVPSAFNGKTIDLLFASDTAGTGKAIPYYYDGTTKTAWPQITVATGDWVIIKAEVAPGPFVGLRLGSATTGSIPVWLTG